MGPVPDTLIGLELPEIQSLLGNDQPRYRARQVYEALYRLREFDTERISTLPLELRRRLADNHPSGIPRIANRFDSVDGTRRYLLELEDQRTVEAVLMPEPLAGRLGAHAERPRSTTAANIESSLTEQSRHTLCISTQVGCPVNCRFCLTALMGLERNLTAGEIVGQVLVMARENGLDPREAKVNVVMMGMGEPLLNLPNVLKATRILTDPRGVGLSERRITVSTSGIIPKIVELGCADVRPKLAVSLNASTEEQRRELMPITRKYSLRDLMEACRAYPLRAWEKLTFEYVLLRGVNDTDADARRVARLLAHLNAKVNLIALNPGPGIPFETPSPERIACFQNIVRRSLPCFVRKPRGRDIFAACGQLKRMKGNDDLQIDD